MRYLCKLVVISPPCHVKWSDNDNIVKLEDILPVLAGGGGGGAGPGRVKSKFVIVFTWWLLVPADSTVHLLSSTLWLSPAIFTLYYSLPPVTKISRLQI